MRWSYKAVITALCVSILLFSGCSAKSSRSVELSKLDSDELTVLGLKNFLERSQDEIISFFGEGQQAIISQDNKKHLAAITYEQEIDDSTCTLGFIFCQNQVELITVASNDSSKGNMHETIKQNLKVKNRDIIEFDEILGQVWQKDDIMYRVVNKGDSFTMYVNRISKKTT